MSSDTLPSEVNTSNNSICAVQEKYDDIQNFWEELLSQYLKHNWSLTCLEDSAKLINKIPSISFKLPETKYKLLKKFREDSDILFNFHIFCEKCSVYTVNKNIENGNETTTNCRKCNKELKLQEHNFFVHIGITNQLKGIIKKYWSEILGYMNSQKNRQENIIKDISDGYVVKVLNEKNKNTYNLSILMNTDGVNIFESNTKSLWPIQFYLNFLPPSIRFNSSNIIVGGLFIGDSKPEVKIFFEPLAREIADLQETQLNVEIGEIHWRFNLSLTHASLDLPAKASIQNIHLYSGSYACSYCLHPGETIAKPNKPNSQQIKKMKYPWTNDAYSPRNNLGLLETMQKMENLSKVKQVIKYIFRSFRYLICSLYFVLIPYKMKNFKIFFVFKNFRGLMSKQ